MNLFKVCFLIFILASSTVDAQNFIGPGKAVDPFNYSIKKQQAYKNGAVACAHPLAAKVGAEILKRGGNAIDAAIATQLALAVVYPGAGNIGGGGFMVARMKSGKAFTLDFRETAPAKASRDMYVDATGKANTALSQYGHLASGVPGTVSGLFESMKWAKLPFKTLIQPAITLAEKGFVLTQAEAIKFSNAQKDFIQHNTITPVFVKEGGWKKGDTLIQPDLAKTLKRIRD